MIKINTKIDTPFFDQLKTVSTLGGKKAMSMAINDSLKTGKTSLKREISQKYNIKQSDVDKNSKIVKSSIAKVNDGKIVVASRLLTVGTSTHFSITPKQYASQKGVKVRKRKIASATIKKQKKKQVKGAFIANPASIKGGNTMLWLRMGGKNRGIKPLKTISIPQMASKKEVYKPVQKSMVDKYNNRFDHYMSRNLDKVKGS